MTVLTNLKATAKDQDWREPAEHHHQVGIQGPRGAVRFLRLGPAGLTIGDGVKSVAIPANELYALAEPFLSKTKP